MKTVWDSLLYLALVASVARLDYELLREPVNSVYSSDEGFGPTSAVHIYLHNPFPYDVHVYPGAKSTLLFQETVDLFREVNSLGRYSRHPLTYNTNVYAYLVSGDQRNQVEASVPSSSSSLSSASPSNPSNSGAHLNVTQLERASSNTSFSGSRLVSQVSEVLAASVESTSNSSVKKEEDSEFGENGPQERIQTDPVSSPGSDIVTEDELGFLLDDLNFASNDPLLSSVFIQREDETDSLFDELERIILSPDEDEDLPPNDSENTDLRFDEGWNAGFNPASVTPLEQENLVNSGYESYFVNTTASHYNINDETNSQLAAAATDLQSAFLPNSAPLVAPSNSVANAVVSSMATLTNGTDPMSDLNEAGYGTDFGDFVYLSNSTATCNASGYPLPEEQIQTSSNEYLLADLLSEEDLQLMEVASGNHQQHLHNQHQQQQHQQQHHHHHNNQQQQQQHHIHRQQPLPIASSSESQKHVSRQTYGSSEDKMDTSSDSAVSSMGSERVSSDADWVDTCSETSSQHGDQGYSHGDYGNPSNNSYFPTASHYPDHVPYNGALAQKKYKLFGRKTETKEEVASCEEQGYYSSGTYDNVACGSYDYYGVNESGFGYAAAASASSGVQSTSENQNPNCAYQSVVLHNHTYPVPCEPMESNAQTIPKQSQPTYGRPQIKQLDEDSRSFDGDYSDDEESSVSRDERRARALSIPILTEEIINLPIDEFNEKLAKYELTEAQLSLIRDIRRRGKNKVAAQNCRKRKMDQIVGLQGEVDSLFLQKDDLLSRQEELLMVRQLARDKYAKLYNLILESSAQSSNHFTAQCPPEYPDADLSSSGTAVGGHDEGFIVPGSNRTLGSPSFVTRSSVKLPSHETEH